MSKWNKGLMAAMEEFEEAQQGALTGTNTQFQNVLETANILIKLLTQLMTHCSRLLIYKI